MFFRPNYCANCGEKIERANWGIFTSRRFCQVCESEYKGADLIPRVIVGLGIGVGLLGLGGYLKSGPGDSDLRTSSIQPRRLIEHQNGARRQSPATPQNSNTGTSSAEDAFENKKGVDTAAPVKKESREPVVKTVISESSYICGAETKKGTPCSRRVRGNHRCFQHEGMPTMLGAAESKVTR